MAAVTIVKARPTRAWTRLASHSALSWERRMSLLQRVLQNFGLCKIRRVVRGRRIGTASLRKGEVFHASSMQQSRKTIVAFDAPRLGIDSVILVALLRAFLFESPRLRPHR